MGIIEDVFQMEGKECKNQERLKTCRRKSMPGRGRYFSIRYSTLSGLVAVDEERFVAVARNSAGQRGSRRTNETPHGTWLDGARKSNLWLCYAGSLTGRQKMESHVIDID